MPHRIICFYKNFQTKITSNSNSKTPKFLSDYQRALDRLKSVPKYLKDAEILLRQGLLSGITFSKESLALNEMKKQFDKIQVNDVAKSKFFQPFKKVFKLTSDIFPRTFLI